MQTLRQPAVSEQTPTGLLPALRAAGIMSHGRIDGIEKKVAGGDYPGEPAELATRLVEDRIITDFQARCLLRGRGRELVVGRYVILDYLAKGAMGRVYRAWHRLMGRAVALKLIDPRLVSDRAIARFRREMQLVGRLDHPNIVRALDADCVGRVHLIAMEYLQGRTLGDLLKARGPLPPADVIGYAAQAAEGLAHAHAQGVLHRDVKPSNLLLTGDRRVKVLDFGLGRLLEPDDQSASLTDAGFSVGTPNYISPEQARQVAIDGRSDLFSLGCTMYHLISGHLPFPGESSMDCLIARITGRPVPINQVMPGLPVRLVEAIEKLLASCPDDRFQSAAEVAEELRGSLRPRVASPAPVMTADTQGDEPTSPPDPEPDSPPLPRLHAPGGGRRPPSPLGSIWPRRSRDAGARPIPGARLSIPRRSGIPGTRRAGAMQVVLLGVGAAVALVLLGNRLARTSGEAGPISPGASPRSDITPVIRPARPGTRTPHLAIESPASGAKVSMREGLVGRIGIDGWPMVFVQSLVPGQPWWLQAPVEAIDGGRFTASVVFGEESTPTGTRFRVAIVAARDQEQARGFRMGPMGSALPAGLARSEEVIVELQ